VAAWTVDITVALGSSVRVADRPMHATRTPVPTVRELLRHPWQ
jgi:hypothetical protein